jgi:hypothetical protein
MHFQEGDVNTTPGIEQPVRLGSLKGICNLEAVTASVRIRGASPSVYTFVISLRLLMSLLSKTNATGPARIFRIAPDAASPLHWECPECLRSSMRWSAEPSSIWHRYRSAAAQMNTAEPLARLIQERQNHHQTEAM